MTTRLTEDRVRELVREEVRRVSSEMLLETRRLTDAFIASNDKADRLLGRIDEVLEAHRESGS